MRRNQLIMVPLVLGTALGVAWLAAGHAATPDHADHQNTEDADGMMEMSPDMMQTMQRMHVGDDSAWDVTDAGVYILRGEQVLRYDPNMLELTDATDLPETASPALGIERDRDADHPHMDMDNHHMDNRDGMDGMRHMDDDDHMAQMRERMQQMHQRMAEAQTALAADLRIVNDAVYVTRGEYLLRYDLDLELTQTADLSDADAEGLEP